MFSKSKPSMLINFTVKKHTFIVFSYDEMRPRILYKKWRCEL